MRIGVRTDIARCAGPVVIVRSMIHAEYAMSAAWNTRFLREIGRKFGMMTVFRVRFTSSAPNVIDLGSLFAKNAAIRSERPIRIGCKELITMHRIPAKGVRYFAA